MIAETPPPGQIVSQGTAIVEATTVFKPFSEDLANVRVRGSLNALAIEPLLVLDVPPPTA